MSNSLLPKQFQSIHFVVPKQTKEDEKEAEKDELPWPQIVANSQNRVTFLSSPNIQEEEQMFSFTSDDDDDDDDNEEEKKEEENENNELYQTEQFDEILNHGGIGTIYQKSSPSFNEPFTAVKKAIPLILSTDPDIYGVSDYTSIREIFVSGCISHPFLLRMVTFSCRYPLAINITYPKASEKSLKDWMYDHLQTLRKNLSEKELAQLLVDIIHQMVLSVAELHSRRLAHLDLKPENWLVFNLCGRIVVRLADFGLSVDTYPQMNVGTFSDFEFCGLGTKEYAPLESHDITTANLTESESKYIRVHKKATEFDQACSQLKSYKRSLIAWKKDQNTKFQPSAEKVDIWSLGMSILELITNGGRGSATPISILRPESSWEMMYLVYGEILQQKSSSDFGLHVLQPLFQSKREKFPILPEISNPHIRNLFLDFLSNCLQWNPSKRASAKTLLQHQLFQFFVESPTRCFDVDVTKPLDQISSSANAQEISKQRTFIGFQEQLTILATQPIPRLFTKKKNQISSPYPQKTINFLLSQPNFATFRRECLTEALNVLFPYQIEELLGRAAYDRRMIRLTCPILICSAALLDLTLLRLKEKKIHPPLPFGDTPWKNKWIIQLIALTCVNITLKKYICTDERNATYLQNLFLWSHLLDKEKIDGIEKLKNEIDAYLQYLSKNNGDDVEETTYKKQTLLFFENNYGLETIALASQLERTVLESLLFLYTFTPFSSYLDLIENASTPEQQVQLWNQCKCIAHVRPFFFYNWSFELNQLRKDSFQEFLLQHATFYFKNKYTDHPKELLLACFFHFILPNSLHQDFLNSCFS